MTWEPIDDLDVADRNSAMVVVQGKVFHLGHESNQIESYDPARADTWNLEVAFDFPGL